MVKIELLYVKGCPHLDVVRAALHDALAGADLVEIDVEAAGAPPWARGWASPTILVDGVELTGAERADGAACRIDCALSADRIRAGIAHAAALAARCRAR